MRNWLSLAFFVFVGIALLTGRLWWDPLEARLGGGSFAHVLVATLYFGLLAAVVFLHQTWLREADEPSDVMLPPVPPPVVNISRQDWTTVIAASLVLAGAAWASHGFAFDGLSALLVASAVILPFCGFVIYSYAKVHLARLGAEKQLALAELQAGDELYLKAKRQYAEGAIAAAIASCESALAPIRKYRPAGHLQIIETLAGLSRMLVQARQFAKAVEYGREAISACEVRAKSSDTRHLSGTTAAIEMRVGEAHMGLQDYPAAWAHFARAARLWQPFFAEATEAELARAGVADHALWIAAFNFAALAADRCGDTVNAIELERELISCLNTRQLEGRDAATLSQTSTLEGLKTVAQLSLNPGMAVQHSQQALCIAQFASNGGAKEIADAQSLLGLAWEEFGGFGLAKHHHLVALQIVQDEYGAAAPECAECLIRLGRTAEKNGDNAEARLRFREALACARAGSNDNDIWMSCLGLAEAMLAGDDLVGVHALIQETMNHLPYDGTGRDQAYSALSELHARDGSHDAAILLGKRAVGLLYRGLDILPDQLRRKVIREDRSYIQRRLADHLIDAGRLAEAQQVLDRLKEFEYDEFVTRGGDGASTRDRLMPKPVGATPAEAAWIRHGDDLEATISILAAEQQILLDKPDRDATETQRLEALRDLLAQAKQRLDEWLNTLVDTLRRERQTAEEQVRDLNLDLQATLRADLIELGSGVALAHFILGTRRLAVILTRPDLQISREIAVNSVDIHGLLHEFRREIRFHMGDDIRLRRLSRELHKYLIAPIAENLEGVETLMVVLHGALRYLPLAALHDGSAYLIERCGVTILTPASYARLKDRPADWGSEGGVGGLGASVRPDRVRPLAAVDDELRAIIREAHETEGIYPGRRYLDQGFTAMALENALQTHRAIHIASHFELDAERNSASALLLGDGTELSLQQLQADRFLFDDVELVTLSACETALGIRPSEAMTLQSLRQMNGAEFESLGTTIQSRGAKAVIATLWAVEDDSTAIVMKNFYRARYGGMTKSAALRSAQLALLRGDGSDKFNHPYFWASFVLMGNWQ